MDKCYMTTGREGVLRNTMNVIPRDGEGDQEWLHSPSPNQYLLDLISQD
jgi:hypothetical protein